MKRLSQTAQTKFFSPVCVRVCRTSSSDRANRFTQPFQSHANGFSPGNAEKTTGSAEAARRKRKYAATRTHDTGCRSAVMLTYLQGQGHTSSMRAHEPDTPTTTQHGTKRFVWRECSHEPGRSSRSIRQFRNSHRPMSWID